MAIAGELSQIWYLHATLSEASTSARENEQWGQQNVDTRLGRVEDDDRGLRDEMNGRFDRMDGRFGEVRSEFGQLRSEMSDRFGEVHAEMNGRFGEVRAEMDRRFDQIDRRFGRVNGLLVTVLLALVIGVGGLWLR